MTHSPITIEPTLTRSHDDERGFGCLETARGRLPLAALGVESRVAGLDVATELRQTFVNTTGVAIEATYIFPLPDRAAVHRFRMTVGERVVEGVIDERGKARDTYDQALAAGQRAAIAEEDRPGVFTLRVGNLMPGDRATVTLHLVGPLPVEDGEVTYVFPLVVAPRYIPGAPLGGEQAGTGVADDTDRVPDASRISPPVLLPGFPSPVQLSLRVRIDGAGLPLAGLRSSLHEVDATPDDSGWRVALRPGERLDRDFVLRWTIGDAALRSAAVWTPDADGDGGTVAVTLVPPPGRAAEARPRDVVLLLDRSGSMSGWKMVAARRAAARIVDSLGERDRFAALTFDDRIEASHGLGMQLVAASDRNRFAAIAYLAAVTDRGGTEMAPALERAAHLLADAGPRDRVLILVTDGQVGDEDEVLRRVTPRLAGARVFTIGIDQAVNAAFLRRLAELGGGADELVESEDQLDHTIARIHRRIAAPVLVDVSLAGDVLESGTQEPTRSPAVFAGRPLVLRARLQRHPRPGEAIALRGRLPSGAEHLESLELAPAPSDAPLAQAWARARIRDLEDRYAVGREDRGTLERTIVALSLRHRVLSRFTAFVAVDPAVVHAGGELHPITQPVEHPAGWGRGIVRDEGGIIVGAASIRGEPKIVGYIPLANRSPDATSRRRKVSGPANPRPGKPKARPRREVDDTMLDSDPATQVARMLELARGLEGAAQAEDPISPARPLLELLGDLLEDLRTDGLTALAEALAPLVKRLHAALAQPNLAAALVDVANALRRLAERGGGSRPRRSRDFWR